MPRQTEAERVKLWESRTTSANKLYDKWSERYETKRLEDYYLGRQWKGLAEEMANKRYVINMIFASIETNKPALVFHRPQVRVQPRPERGSDLGSMGEDRSLVCQDMIQTIIDDPDIDFALETSLALQEAHFRFGVVEVGYTADWIDNPNAGKPVLKEDKDEPVTDKQGKEVLQGDRIVESEQLFVKRVPSANFRVSVQSKNKLGRNDWVGYFEWHYVEDVKRNKNYKNTAGVKAGGVLLKELRPDSDGDLETERKHGMVKVWKIWDIRAGVRHTIAEGHDKFLQEGVKFKFLPFATIKFHEILDSFYPLPPVYQWLGPQDEVNETREMQRAHRRRFYRRYTYQEGAIDDTELEKLENGGDGVCAKANQPNPLTPVQDAPLSSDVWQHLDASKQDFMTVSGIGGDQRGVAESETATQASIIDVRSKLRESSARTRVGDWLAAISRLILLTAREYMTLPIWIQRNVDPIAGLQNPAEAERIAGIWQQISSEELGDTDLDVFVDLASMSPVTEDAQRNSWNQVLMLMTNIQILTILAQSEVLMRRTLTLYGIRAENEIQEIMKVAQATIQMMQQQAAAEAAAKAKLPGSTAAISEGGAGGASPEGTMGEMGGSPMTPEMMAMAEQAAAAGVQ
jgi:hypothetical protein